MSIFAASETVTAAKLNQVGEKGISFIVRKNGATYEVLYGNSGQQATTPKTNASEAIQTALDALTVGRTHQETVLLTGNLGNVKDVVIPNYTRILGSNCKLTLNNGDTCIFKRSETSTADQIDITIENIYFKGYGLTAGDALDFYKVVSGNYIGIINLKIYNCVFESFYIGAYLFTYYSEISGNTFKSCMQDINIANDHGSVFCNNQLYIGDPDGVTNCYGMQFIDSNASKIRDNHFLAVEVGDTNYMGLVADAQFINCVVSGNTFRHIKNYGIYLGTVDRPPGYEIEHDVISDNTFDACTGTCIYLNEDAHDVKIIGNTISGSDYGINLSAASNDCIIANNTFVADTTRDINIGTSYGGTISGNIFTGQSTKGIYLASCEGFTVTGNRVTNKTTAINLYQCGHCTVTGNFIITTQQIAVLLDGSIYNTVTGNAIKNSSQQTHGTYFDIYIVNTSTYNTVCNNTLAALESNKAAWNIIEAAGADNYNLYAGNICVGGTAGAISVAGANSVRGDNIPASG